MPEHERVEDGKVSKSGDWAIGIHSIVARCLLDTRTNGESEAAASCAWADPSALVEAESVRAAARERDAQPKGASRILSEAFGCAWGSKPLVPSGGFMSNDRHVGLSAAQRFEHVVRDLTSAKDRSHPCSFVCPTCKTATKTIPKGTASTPTSEPSGVTSA